MRIVRCVLAAKDAVESSDELESQLGGTADIPLEKLGLECVSLHRFLLCDFLFVGVGRRGIDSFIDDLFTLGFSVDSEMQHLVSGPSLSLFNDDKEVKLSSVTFFIVSGQCESRRDVECCDTGHQTGEFVPVDLRDLNTCISGDTLKPSL